MTGSTCHTDIGHKRASGKKLLPFRQVFINTVALPYGASSKHLCKRIYQQATQPLYHLPVFRKIAINSLSSLSNLTKYVGLQSSGPALDADHARAPCD